MYAIVADSGKQFFVEEGKKVVVDLKEVEPGQSIEFANVLMVGGGAKGAVIGKPTVAGAKVVGEVVGNIRGPKLHVGTYKRRKNYRRHRGHRQDMTEVMVKQIVG